MGELLHSLGINGKLLFAQALNFGLVLFVLWKFAYKPILKTLDGRQARIAQGEADAAAAAQSKADAEREREELLRETRREATAILSEARAAGDAARARAMEEAEAERSRVRERAKQEAEAEKAHAVSRAKSEVADLVALATGKLLGRELTEVTQRRLVEQALKELRR